MSKKWVNSSKFGSKKSLAKTMMIQCDEMITKPTSIFQRLDTHTLLRDHEQRGKDIYHFYLTHFRPLWTDSTCEGYHAENFGMVFGKNQKKKTMTLYLQKKTVLQFLMILLK